MLAYLIDSTSLEYEKYLYSSNFMSAYNIESMTNGTPTSQKITITNNIITIPQYLFSSRATTSNIIILAWRED